MRPLAAYLRRLVPFAAHLRHVDAALTAWGRFEADEALPPLLRRELPEPSLGRATLGDRRAAVLGLIAEWEAGWARRN